MTTSIIQTIKGKIEYSLRGRGKAVVIVHGGHINCSETIFQKGLDAEKFCFITPSRPGYGNTPLTNSNKTPEGTAELFIALLDELKFSKVIVIGVSAGGLTALEIAANYPDRIESLILMSALTKKWFVETDSVYRGAKKLFAPNIEGFTWGLYKMFFNLFPKLMTKTMFKALSKSRPITFTKDEFDELKEITLKMRSGYGFNNDLDQTINQDILSRVMCPTLILHSENDNSVDMSHPLNAKEKIKDATLSIFNIRWGHMLWIGKDYEPILKQLKQQMNS
jgi:pimeloyl-ACP methyl ester carboxylesterase